MVTGVTVAVVITAVQNLVPLVGEPRRTPASLRDHLRWEPTTKSQCYLCSHLQTHVQSEHLQKRHGDQSKSLLDQEPAPSPHQKQNRSKQSATNAQGSEATAPAPKDVSTSRPDREEAETTERLRDLCFTQRLLESLKDAAAPTTCWEDKNLKIY